MPTLTLFGLLFGLLLMGVPIAVALGMSTTVTLLLFTDQPTLIIAQKMFTSLDKFALMAIPLFVLAGNFLSQGGAAKRIIRFARSLVGHLPGGLPMSAIFACIIFAAVSGSSPATVAAIGSIMIGAIKEDGYSSSFSVGSIVCAGSLGILIPPSIILIVYGVTVDQSIGKLFMAGVVPGILLGGMLMVVTYFAARKQGFKHTQRASGKEIWTAFKDASWGLFVVVIIIGGIYGGLFTPTEAAAVSAVYGFFVVKFIYKDLSWKQIPEVIKASASTAAMIMFIIANAMVFAYLLTIQQIPQDLAAWIIGMHLNKYMFLVFVNLLLLAGRQLHGALEPDHDHRPADLPGGDEARHRPDPPRRDHHRQHGDRHADPAGGAQPVRRQRHLRPEPRRGGQGLPPLVLRPAGRPADHLPTSRPSRCGCRT